LVAIGYDKKRFITGEAEFTVEAEMDLLSLPSLANLCVNNRHKGNQISIRN